MADFVQYLILGLGLGAAYALTAQGLVVIHRGSGVVNFGNSAFGLAGAYLEYELRLAGVPAPLAVLIALVAAAALGLLAHYGIMRHLWSAAQLTRVVATLGMLTVIDGLANLKIGDSQLIPPYLLPNHGVTVLGRTVSSYNFWLLGIAVVITGVLQYVYRRTRFGVLTAAAAENRRAAAALGHSPDTVAAANWVLGSVLAAAAAILIAPVLSLTVTAVSLMLVPALAGAVMGDFTSFGVTLLGTLLVGVAESMVQWANLGQGWPDAVPFAAVIVILLFKGTALPGRAAVQFRLPKVGTGAVNWKLGVPAVVAAGVLGMFTPAGFTGAMYITAATAIILLSSVVVTGYAGQLSLAQLGLAGLGAFIGSTVAEHLGLGFWPALLIAVAGILPVGVVSGVPALRTRGVNLAIVTLGIGVIVDEVILANPDYTGGYSGTQVQPPTLFGLSLNAEFTPGRYLLLCLAFLVVCMLAVSNLRRSSVGRYLIAVRGNERAAASLGLHVARLKLYAFAVSAVLAAIGGMLIIYQAPFVNWSTGWDVVTGISLLGGLVLAGLGYTSGSVAAALAATGGIMPYLLGLIGNNATNVLTPLLGCGMILAVIKTPDGAIAMMLVQRAARRQRKRPAESGQPQDVAERPAAAGQEAPANGVEALHGHRLELDRLSVSFGGIKALRDVSFAVGSGEIVALIGPNGAGKTTLIDIVTGMTRQSSGSVVLDGRDISRLPAATRARIGLTRSFQALELFDDLTVRENILVSVDRNRWWHYLQAFVAPRRGELSPQAQAAVAAFGLTGDLDSYPAALPYGRRRLVGIVRAIASGASIVALDEPAAGLDEHESAELAGLLRMLADRWGLGILLVEHDISLVMSVSDRVAALDFGQLLHVGEPEQVRHDPRVISAYLGGAADDPGPQQFAEKAKAEG